MQINIILLKMPRTGTRRVSGRQLDSLWEFLNSHRDVAVAYNRSLQAKEYSTRKWMEIAETLNCQGEGAHKDWRGWSKYWVDYKAKLKKRATAVRSSHTRTGGGPSSEPPLSDIESKFLQILGEDLGQGMPGIQVEPFIQHSQSTAAADVEESQVVSEPTPSTSRVDPPIENPLEENPQDIPSQLSVPVATNTNRSPTLSPQPTSTATAAVRSPRRRRRRREQPMTQEAARRALVQSSQQRADAAVRSSATLERIEQRIASIQEIWLRMERTINAVFARAPEQEHSG